MAYPPRPAMTALVTANFLVALGYGALLPVLPGIVRQLEADATWGDTIWHTGLVTAAYASAALITAPVWGRLSDHLPGARLIVLALLLTGISTIAGAFATSLSSLYLWRFATGIGAGAILPATQAWLGRWAADDAAWQTRRVVVVGIAANAGLFVGPLFGGLAENAGSWLGVNPEVTLQLPFLFVGALLVAFAAIVWSAVGQAPAPRRADITGTRLLGRTLPILATLLMTALAIGAFEVALSFMTTGEKMSPFEIGLLFAQCTLFMIAAQSLLILPRFRDRPLKPFIIPALLILALGLTLMVFASGIIGHAVSTGLVAIGGGLLPPILAHEIALMDGGASGSATGYQVAASQAGQTGGAILAGSIAALSEPQWVFAAVALGIATTAVAVARSHGWVALKTTIS